MSLEDLLRETFAAHEELADPAAASRIAVEARDAGDHRGLLVPAIVAAAVLLLAGGIGVVATHHGSSEQGAVTTPIASSSSGPPSALPSAENPRPDQTNAGNRAIGERLAAESLSAVATYPGARPVHQDEAGPLRRLNSFLGMGGRPYGILRSRFLRVGSAAVHEVSAWYAQHPPNGFTTDGGPSGIGGGRTLSGVFADEVIYDETRPPRGASAGLLVQVAPDGGDVAVRITTFTTWDPVRTRASLVGDEVISVTARQQSTRYDGRRPETRRLSLDSTMSAAVVRRFDTLPGWPQAVHGCPVPTGPTYGLAFHTRTGTLHAAYDSCYGVWFLTRDGTRIMPSAQDSSDDDDASLIALVEQAFR